MKFVSKCCRGPSSYSLPRVFCPAQSDYCARLKTGMRLKHLQKLAAVPCCSRPSWRWQKGDIGPIVQCAALHWHGVIIRVPQCWLWWTLKIQRSCLLALSPSWKCHEHFHTLFIFPNWGFVQVVSKCKDSYVTLPRISPQRRCLALLCVFIEVSIRCKNWGTLVIIERWEERSSHPQIWLQYASASHQILRTFSSRPEFETAKLLVS